MFQSVRFFYEPLSMLAGSLSKAGAPMAASLQAAMGVAQMIRAGKQQRQANKMARNLIRPEYRTPQPVVDNLSLSESRASQGLGDAAMATYENNMDRTLTTSIDAILRGAGSAATIGDLYDSAEDNFANLAMLEEEIRLKNAQIYMQANERMAEGLDTEFQVNQWAPYKDDQQAIAALSAQAAQNKSNGLNTIGSAFVNYFQGNMMQGDINGVYGNRGGTVPGGLSAPNNTAMDTIGFARPGTANGFLPVNPTRQDIYGNISGRSPLQPTGGGVTSYADFIQSIINSSRR